MWIPLTGYKVVYDEKVLRALALVGVTFKDGNIPEIGKTTKPRAIEILVINEDGNIVSIFDEAWRFQFIPAIEKGC